MAINLQTGQRIILITVAITAIIVCLTSCQTCIGFDVDPQILQKEIYKPTKHKGLNQNVVLYIDHSTCVIDAVKNTNSVLTHLIPNLSVYTDELVLIKGNQLEEKQLQASSKTDKITEIWGILKGIQNDVPYAEIKEAVKKICASNQQAVLITDCEYFVDGIPSDAPYMSAGFKEWLQKGHSIYVVVEPYQERYKNRLYDKKRFYFFFTNDRLQAPISNLIESELPDDGSYTKFKLTNSDIFVQSPKSDMVAEDLTFNVDYKKGFEFISIDDPWSVIQEYVMKLDKYGEPIENENPVPLVKNLVFYNGNNYIVSDVEIIATNITERYLSADCQAADNLKLDCKKIKPNDVDMSESFRLDKKALQSKKLTVFLTDKIFNYLTDQYCGNLIRLDFVVTEAILQNYDADMFSWQSLYDNTKVICVAKSIDNVLRDIEIVPMAKDRRIIHTIFIKTEPYK